MGSLPAEIQRLIRHVFVADKKWCNEEELIYIADILLGKVAHLPRGDSDDDADMKADTINLLKQGSTMQHIPFREPHWLIRIPDQTLFDERFPRRRVILLHR